MRPSRAEAAEPDNLVYFNLLAVPAPEAKRPRRNINEICESELTEGLALLSNLVADGGITSDEYDNLTQYDSNGDNLQKFLKSWRDQEPSPASRRQKAMWLGVYVIAQRLQRIDEKINVMHDAPVEETDLRAHRERQVLSRVVDPCDGFNLEKGLRLTDRLIGRIVFHSRLAVPAISEPAPL